MRKNKGEKAGCPRRTAKQTDLAKYRELKREVQQRVRTDKQK